MRGIVLAACLLAGGCGGSIVRQPTPVDSPNLTLQSIARGTTTKDQVRALFRQGPQIEPVQNGEQWTYQSSSKLAGGNYIPGVGFTPETEERRIVVIVFDNQGIVADFTSYTEVH